MKKIAIVETILDSSGKLKYRHWEPETKEGGKSSCLLIYSKLSLDEILKGVVHTVNTHCMVAPEPISDFADPVTRINMVAAMQVAGALVIHSLGEFQGHDCYAFQIQNGNGTAWLDAKTMRHDLAIQSLPATDLSGTDRVIPHSWEATSDLVFTNVGDEFHENFELFKYVDTQVRELMCG